MRDRLAEDAGYALWLVIVVREACGLNSTRGDADLQGPQRGLRLHGAIRHVCRQNCRDARNDYGNYVDYDDYLPGALAERIPVKSPTRSAPPVAQRYLADAWQG